MMRDERSQSVPNPAPSATAETPHSPRSSWLLVLGWCLLALYLVTTFVIVEGREPTWEDEMIVQSTAWSIVHGGPSNMSVDGIYPHNISPERFFGPVSIHAGIVIMKLFGLKMWPWRMVCFLFGQSLLVVSNASLLLLAGRSRWLVLAGAGVTAVSSTYCLLLPGRWDADTIALVLAGVAFMLYAVKASWGRLACQSCTAGILFGIAAGSTPRALAPLAAAGCGMMVGTFLEREKKVRFLVAGIVAAISSVVTDTILLAPLGMTPWSWLKFLRTASKKDPIARPPFLGGYWYPEFSTHKIVIILAVLLLVAGLISAFAQHRRGAGAHSVFQVVLSVMALANLGISVLVVSRLLGYAIFWLPFLPVVSFCWISWDTLRLSGMRYLIASLICLEVMLPTVLEVERIHTAIKLWKSRDPQILLGEIRKYIPPGSIVFGPIGGYFFPVEQSGSRYLYLEDDIMPGLIVDDDSSTYRREAINAAACTAPTFTVWPRSDAQDSIPDEVIQHTKIQLMNAQSAAMEDLVIYRLMPPENCAEVQFDTETIKPFGAF